VFANFLEMPFPECCEDDHQVLRNSTCQVAPSVSRARNLSAVVLCLTFACGAFCELPLISRKALPSV
jgi:hypothetical protein